MKDCFPGQPRTLEQAIASSASSVNGAVLTPKGELKILVVFAGYEEESRTACQSTYMDPSWPNVNYTQADGETYPANLGNFFYTTQSQFSSAATDQTLSNFFYQMSRTSASPFRVTFGFLPARINVSAASYGNNLEAATTAVLNAAVTRFPTFDWASYDQRTNRPEYAFDNSTTGPDGKLDYVVVCWRTFQSCGVTMGPSSGYAGPNCLTNIAIPPAGTRTQTLYLRDGHVQTAPMGGAIDRGAFLHEFAHNLYNAPHQLGANGVHGNHFYVTQGWGMMSGLSTFFSANAWERWYNGWTELRTGPAATPSDIQDATSLTATNGVYTLRDYVSMGDVIRIKIPNTNQSLWLENRAKVGPFDRRVTYDVAGDGVPFLAAPVGLVAMVENLASRTVPLVYNDIFSVPKVNKLRTLSAEGSYEYAVNGAPATYNNHMWGQLLYNFLPTLSPTSGQNQVTGMRFDANGDNVITYEAAHGNLDVVNGNEGKLQVVKTSQINDGFLGPNIGTRTVGFRYGLGGSTVLTDNPTYNATTQTLTELPLNGLSVQITAYDAITGDLTLKVRYNDTEVLPNARWTGQLRTHAVANATSTAELWLNNGSRLTLARGTTPQRSSRGPGNDFVNDTRLTISANTRLRVESAGNLDLRGQGTTLYVEPAGSVSIGGGGKVTAYTGTTISLENRADLTGSGELKAGAQLVVRSTGQVISGPATW